jgi:hypothetical protein
MSDLTQIMHRTGSLTKRQTSRYGTNSVWMKSAIEKEHNQARPNELNGSNTQVLSIDETKFSNDSALDQSLNECELLSRRPSGRFTNRNKLSNFHRLNHSQLSVNNVCSTGSNTNAHPHPSDHLINYLTNGLEFERELSSSRPAINDSSFSNRTDSMPIPKSQSSQHLNDKEVCENQEKHGLKTNEKMVNNTVIRRSHSINQIDSACSSGKQLGAKSEISNQVLKEETNETKEAHHEMLNNSFVEASLSYCSSTEHNDTQRANQRLSGLKKLCSLYKQFEDDEFELNKSKPKRQSNLNSNDNSNLNEQTTIVTSQDQVTNKLKPVEQTVNNDCELNDTIIYTDTEEETRNANKSMNKFNIEAKKALFESTAKQANETQTFNRFSKFRCTTNTKSIVSDRIMKFESAYQSNESENSTRLNDSFSVGSTIKRHRSVRLLSQGEHLLSNHNNWQAGHDLKCSIVDSSSHASKKNKRAERLESTNLFDSSISSSTHVDEFDFDYEHDDLSSILNHSRQEKMRTSSGGTDDSCLHEPITTSSSSSSSKDDGFETQSNASSSRHSNDSKTNKTLIDTNEEGSMSPTAPLNEMSIEKQKRSFVANKLSIESLADSIVTVVKQHNNEVHLKDGDKKKKLVKEKRILISPSSNTTVGKQQEPKSYFNRSKSVRNSSISIRFNSTPLSSRKSNESTPVKQCMSSSTTCKETGRKRTATGPSSLYLCDTASTKAKRNANSKETNSLNNNSLTTHYASTSLPRENLLSKKTFEKVNAVLVQTSPATNKTLNSSTRAQSAKKSSVFERLSKTSKRLFNENR